MFHFVTRFLVFIVILWNYHQHCTTWNANAFQTICYLRDQNQPQRLSNYVLHSKTSRIQSPCQRENGGTLGMVPLIINPREPAFSPWPWTLSYPPQLKLAARKKGIPCRRRWSCSMASQKGEWMTNLFGWQLNLYFRKLRTWEQKRDEGMIWRFGEKHISKEVMVDEILFWSWRCSGSGYMLVIRVNIDPRASHIFSSRKGPAIRAVPSFMQLVDPWNLWNGIVWRRCSFCHTKNTIQHMSMCHASIETYFLMHII